MSQNMTSASATVEPSSAVFEPNRQEKSKNVYTNLILVAILLINAYYLLKNYLILDGAYQTTSVRDVVTSTTITTDGHVNEIKAEIARYNQERKIYNEELFGPVTNDSLVIVVQVHVRLPYLKKLIESLSASPNISKALLIFSHDYFDKDINEEISSISFCKYMQIFYPFSLQTHVGDFPGENPDDCKKGLSQQEAIDKKCKNAFYQDSYSHHREATTVQIKLHWWWKANAVFNYLMRGYSGLVLFLEEDHYVLEDFMHVLQMMQNVSSEYCEQCIFSLGDHTKLNLKRNSNKVKLSDGVSNLGLAFDRTIWKLLSSCAEEFCKYDDYNWDWTLLYIMKTCMPSDLVGMILAGSRVVHIGKCGFHHKGNNCDPAEGLKQYSVALNSSKQLLFPKYLNVINTINTLAMYITKNGGFADPRDQALCLGIST